MGRANETQRPATIGSYDLRAEPTVTSGLSDRGCTLMISRSLDAGHKIDALLLEIDDRGHCFRPVGLQITRRLDDREKIMAFCEGAATWPNIGSLLYIEIEGAVTHKMCKVLKIEIESFLDEIENIDRNRKASQLHVGRIRINERGEHQWLPLRQ